MSSTPQSGACPYAAQLSDDDNSGTSADDASIVPSEILELAKSSCPAFKESNSCPFKDVKNSSEIRKTLAQVPPSHYAMNTNNTNSSSSAAGAVAFQKALRHLHNVSLKMNCEEDAKYRLPGGCPVKDQISLSTPRNSDIQNNDKHPAKVQSLESFGQAMEEYSLAAIMAKMAQDLEDDDEKKVLTPEAAIDSAVYESTLTVEPSVSAGVETTAPTKDGGNNGVLSSSDAPTTAAATTTTIQSSSLSTIAPKRPSLAEALKNGTAISHQAAEDVHFVKNFIRGKIDRTLYGELVLSLHHVYKALEDQLNRHAPTHFATCHFPQQLSRQEALEDDLDFWKGSSQTTNNTMSPATQDYVDRIHHIAKTDPLMLLSHAYTRYLGDLSGGKILARVARRAMDLDKDGTGLRFYHFDQIQNAKQFKDTYRQSLDDLVLSSKQISKLVAEANVAFVLNMRIFEELDVLAAVPGSSLRKVEDALAYANMVEHEDDAEEEEAKCPFGYVNGDSGNGNEKSHGNRMDLLSRSVGTTHHEQQQSSTATTNTQKKDRCPWPFIFSHDPITGIQDWQTW
eukprot:CAMPEP_0195290310 /NCGR_PEP_ID=MMETSP0707-20130614/6223_1 /TAXON_ID=33640 /ORGANISM="Asterionellopsis glacialis, Strain CCMP134" /LENGTH=566 /DNA_ID=CAMNT_0040350423 /DNA_START=96 /DNA_END=1793 /DNA_ORIENTATION=+